MEIKGIEVSGEVYDITDETARTNAESASNVATEAKEAVETVTENVETITETANTAKETAEGNAENIGNLSDLETTEKTSLVAAVNEVNGKIPLVLPVVAGDKYDNIDHPYSFNEDESAEMTTAEIRKQLQSAGGDLVDGRTYFVVAMYNQGIVWRQGAFKYSASNGWSYASTMTGSNTIIYPTATGLSFEKSGSSTETVYPTIIG